jgi:hypothetical protein
MNFDFLIEKEKCLELDEYRLSKAKLSELISKDFMEVRSNGDIENKLEVIEGIFEDNEVGLAFKSFDHRTKRITDELGFVIYKTKTSLGDSNDIICQRSSL